LKSAPQDEIDAPESIKQEVKFRFFSKLSTVDPKFDLLSLLQSTTLFSDVCVVIPFFVPTFFLQTLLSRFWVKNLTPDGVKFWI